METLLENVDDNADVKDTIKKGGKTHPQRGDEDIIKK